MPGPDRSRLASTGRRHPIRAGLVACTGSTGCRFAGADTKGHAEDIARWCEERVTLDSPVNIHLTGCHHSCAQHYIGDIGLIGAQGSGERGGRHASTATTSWSAAASVRTRRIGRELSRDVKAEDAPAAVERLLQAYLAHRAGPDETFQAFTRRHDVEALQRLSRGVRPHERAHAVHRFAAPVLPENAPFSPEQRSWLNGFFAGLLSLDGAA